MKKELSFSIIFFVFTIATVQAQSDDIQATQREGCMPLQVSLWTNIGNVESYFWDLGNGTTSILPDPTVLYKFPGNYDIKLIIKKKNGTTDTIFYKGFIKVIDKSIPEFEFVDLKSCDSVGISFKNKSQDANRYIWDFGDGTSSTEENPVHYYSKAGDYRVSLIAYNHYGCGAAQVKEKQINIKRLEFTADRFTACENDQGVAFRTTGNYKSFKWNFGDGSVSSEAQPHHIYSESGIYSVTLTVTDSLGCTSSLAKNAFIVVNPTPAISFEVSDPIVCDEREVTFKAVNPSNESVYWKFDDGFFSTEKTFTRRFEKVDNHHVEITFKNEFSCSTTQRIENVVQVKEPVNTEIEISNLTGCVPHILNLKNVSKNIDQCTWMINNQKLNGIEVDQKLEKVGEYAIKTITTFKNGCVQEYVHTEKAIINKPVNSIRVSSYEGCTPLSTTIELTDQEVTDVLWNFGNGTTSEIPLQEVIYSDPGTYQVKVKYKDKNGCSDSLSLSKEIQVFDTVLAYEVPPTINTCSYSKVDFYGGMGKDVWLWDFGDGNSSNEMNPSHHYSQPGKYVVSLKTKNKNGCPTTIPVYNEINYSELEIDFSYKIIESSHCPEFTAQFNLLSPDQNSIDKVMWDFGFAKSNEMNPVQDFFGNGEVNVKVTVHDKNGCSRSMVSIMQPPWPYCIEMGKPKKGEEEEIRTITLHEISSCSAPFEVSFSDPWPDAVEVLWDFGDGHTSKEREPKHTYKNYGEYMVDYYAKFENGEKDTIIGYVKVNVKNPAIDYSYQIENTCAGVEATFVSNTIIMQDFSWIFSNGDKSEAVETSRIYQTDKIDQVVLIGTDTLGCKATAVKNIAVGNPNKKFSYSTNICLGDTVQFDHNLQGYAKYKWIFGDGTTSNEIKPKHRFKKWGKMDVKIEATDYTGCVETIHLPEQILVNNPIADFSIAGPSYGCNLLNVSFKNLSQDATNYLWRFSDGQTSTAAHPKINFKPGSHHVMLTASKNGCENTITKENLVQVDVFKVDFAFEQESTCLPANVAFLDKSTDVVNWNWDFGDGTSSNEQHPVHLFSKFPTKNVVLKADNGKGCTVSKSMPIQFFQSDFIVTDSEGCYPFATGFEERSPGAVSWHWDFGDGTTSNERNPKHTYMNEGKYHVTLKAESAEGCIETTIKEEIVKVGHIKSNFTAQIDESICAPLLVNFTNTSLGATTFEWDFGDGSSSTLINPFHVFSKVGLFDVKLIAGNDIGCSDTLLLKKLITTSGPETDFVASDTIVCNPKQVSFTDKSVSAISWLWFFGDGNTSSSRNAVHQYEKPGSYEVTLSSVDAKGCLQIKSDTIKVYPTPIADFDLDISGSCMPVSVKTINHSTELMEESFIWSFGDKKRYTSLQPIHVFDQPGSYKISLTVANGGVCLDSTEFNREIIVRDTFNYVEPVVYEVSVTDDSKVKILYEKTLGNSFKHHLIFRKSDKENNYYVLDTIQDQMNKTFVDESVLPNHNSYQYKIQTHSYCRPPSQLSALKMYSTIQVKNHFSNKKTSLTWNSYHGHSFKKYSVQRKTVSGEWIEIAKLDSSITSYTDVELCPQSYLYRIVAKQLDGRDYHSFSNTVEEIVTTNYSEQQVNLIRSTVLDNNQVLTEWRLPNFGANNVFEYEIYRSVNNGTFKKIGSVPGKITTFIDQDVKTDQNVHTYRIEIKNTCDIQTLSSNIGKTILLQKESINYKNRLFWTNYEGWQNGVKNYQLQKQNNFGEWETIKVISPNEREVEIDLEIEK